MSHVLDRRELLKLAGLGGIVFGSRLLTGCASGPRPAPAPSPALVSSPDFYFMQLSDTHWGFSGPAVNPYADIELKAAVAAINAVRDKPDFVVFTGDLTHSTDDPAERRKRMGEFKQIVGALQVPIVKFMPGEHDAAADGGEAYREFFGDLHYAFEHKGIQFIVLDNVSDPRATIGPVQLEWLKRQLGRLDAEAPIVVFTHRPLWDLKPEWEWTTADGQQVLDALAPHRNVTVFFGHIHQELHHQTGHIVHHAARSLIFPLPPPETQGERAPVPYDPARQDRGLGYRDIAAAGQPIALTLTEVPLARPEREPAVSALPVIRLQASRWAFTPETIELARDVPIVLELMSRDVQHGFNAPGLQLRGDVMAGQVTRFQLTPKQAGTYPFHCDYYCGSGHEGMTGRIIVR